METRKLASIFVSFLNAFIQVAEEAVEMVEKELAKGDDDKPEKGEKKKDEEKSSRSSRSSRSSKKDDDDDDDDDDEKKGDDDDDDDDKKKGDDEPSEDDCVDAVRAALKVLDRADVTKLVKKYGKADKASEVEPENRQKLIDALEKAVDAA